MCESVLNEAEILKFVPEGRVAVLNTVHSTNQYIIENLNYLRSGDVFVTEHQTQGRGRRGKTWISFYGKSICFSMYYKLYRKIPVTTSLSIMISIIAAKVLKDLGVSQIKIKWPNDLYVYEKKLAGILIEILTKNNKISHLIIGIGINVSICDMKELKAMIKKNWIDLKSIGITLNNNIVVANLVNSLRQKLKYFKGNEYISGVYCQEIKDYLYNKSVILLSNNRIVQYGIFIGIQSNGMLSIIDKAGKIYQYYRDDISVCLI